MMDKPFGKVLIANRGEIAIRVMSTCKALGIKTVAVFSDADAEAAHVTSADEAVRIGPAAAAESYLRGEKIIAAAQATGAEAIHPGYGFLSENAEFAEACAAAGITFIGPSAEAIRAMGRKDAAKALMEQAGVPVVPGYLGEDQSAERLAKEAERVGYPLLIKAVAGGGGKGMRKVDTGGDFADALTSCRREAKNSFGDDTVLIERFITTPRHIEVQVFGDSHGNAVHFFERDCSIQRRHQKVVEEAPAPGMTGALRKRMTEAAVKAAKAISYANAGTVEFIVDGEGGLRDDTDFFFMEMNTRLQVEHPVTEEVTGRDLVELQLCVAAGGALPAQENIHLTGHAIELRLYAEDPAKGFLPQAGPVVDFEPAWDRLRVDTAVFSGDEVSRHYDPMIAKFTAKGDDRAEAIANLRAALQEVHILGLPTNLDFLRRIVGHGDFADASLDTGFIDRNLDDLLAPGDAGAPENVALVTMALVAHRLHRARRMAAGSDDPNAPWVGLAGWRLNMPYSETIPYTLPDGAAGTVTLTGDGARYALGVGETTIDCRLVSDGWQDLEVEVDGTRHRPRIFVQPDAIHLATPDGIFVYGHRARALAADDEAEGQSTVTAPMPGKVLEVRVKEGQEVDKGEALLILEAMKMEHTLTAPRAGRIEALKAAAGEQVVEGAVLVTIADE